jgi:hypothetical protein
LVRVTTRKACASRAKVTCRYQPGQRRTSSHRASSAEAADVAVAQFDLAGVQPGPDVQADPAQLVLTAAAQPIPRPGPPKVARMPSPVVLMSWPPNSSTSERPVDAWKLDELCSGDVLGQVATVLDRNELEVRSVQDQRWRLDQREQRAQVPPKTLWNRAWTVRGVAALRSRFANQRRKRGSSARLGATIVTMASVPHSWSIWARSVSATSAEMPIG